MGHSRIVCLLVRGVTPVCSCSECMTKKTDPLSRHPCVPPPTRPEPPRAAFRPWASALADVSCKRNMRQVAFGQIFSWRHPEVSVLGPILVLLFALGQSASQVPRGAPAAFPNGTAPAQALPSPAEAVGPCHLEAMRPCRALPASEARGDSHFSERAQPGSESPAFCLQPDVPALGSSAPHPEASRLLGEQRSSSAGPAAFSQGQGSACWCQIPTSSTQKPVSVLFSSRFQPGAASRGARAPDRTANGLQMAGPQETMPALPLREGAQMAAATSIPLPTLKRRLLDHPLDQGLLQPTQCLCGPPLAPIPNSPKKPKTQASGDTFPSDWSPPPVEFLNPRGPQRSQLAPARSWGDAVRPQSPGGLAQQPPRPWEQQAPDSDPEEALISLKELFWSMASPSRPAAALQFLSGRSEPYVNSLDCLLQEKREQALEQEREERLLQDFPHLTSLDPVEDEVALMPEHRRLVEKFSVSLQAFPPVHPGETVFLPRSHPCPCILDSSQLKPQSHLERLFLSSPPAQQLSFLHSGLLSNLYLHAPARPVPLLRWLFQLLTWPPETSLGAFGLLWDLSVDWLFRQPDKEVTPLWCPTVQEVVEAFHSLGAQSPAPYPVGPLWSGGNVLENGASEHCSGQPGAPQEPALDASLSYICKFLSLCVLARPEAYSDQSLLGLMELFCRAGLDTGLRLLPKTDLQQLLLLLLENVREWPGKLQPLCCALSWVSDHHHNLLALVQFFPDVTHRGRQLRSQLSLVVIARMLGQQETLPLWQEKTQLSSLGRLLSLMGPASLRQCLASAAGPGPPRQEQQPQSSAELDHQVCYLCHSLLMLAGLVVGCQDIAPHQWGELQLLCMHLDRHVSTHIRESPQAMHRTRLKDLAAQTYVRWQELLAHCQPEAQYFSPWKDT
ncbi:LOW QUALITY PROTEIN: protein FAM178B [Choloepus didactylus]|uniref:LOW QUALITY PROTEIN: protein FAM178B n=1 Tax=Choloepus didactylus TaxID=27675 RepID=UPI0018A07DD2|nr:LOW QUALITY PROTEIN: protein FAM178B [Choloepus didactylus]